MKAEKGQPWEISPTPRGTKGNKEERRGTSRGLKGNLRGNT